MLQERQKYLDIAEKEVEKLLSITYEEFLDSDKKEFISKHFYLDNALYLNEIDSFTALQELKPQNFFPDEYLKSMQVIQNANKRIKNRLKILY